MVNTTKIIIIASLCIISFGLGRYLREKEVRGVQWSSDSTELDTLIAFWVAERNATDPTRMMSMDERHGEYRFGFFPDHIRALADTVEQRYGVPSAVILAQFALESGFGVRDLGVHNYFGHTYPFRFASPAPGYVTRTTREFVNGEWVIVERRFAAYIDSGHAFDAHGRLLATVYAWALDHRNNPPAFARAIAPRYATDPDYALKLITIMKRYKLLKGNA
jgi:flagellum-specific peptidoglycan hydrolase FlgJ